MTALGSRARGVALALCAAFLTAVAAAIIAGPAWAHAVLVAADPPDGSDLDAAPAAVELSFNEPVEVATDALRVYDADATRVDTGQQDDGDPRTVTVGLPSDLPDGGYVVTYRVLSADSHPIAGVLTFTVGGAAAVDDATVAELFGGAGSTTVGIVGPVLRGLGYVATLLAAGAVGIATAARRLDHRALARRVGVPAAITGAVLAVVAVPFQGAAVAGVSVLEAATSARILGDVASSGFGEGTIVRVLALAVLAVAWRRASPALLVGLAAGLSLGSYLRDGHQRTVEPIWLLVSGDALHLAAGAVWFGGLVVLGLVLRTTARSEPVAAAGFVARFSTAALWSVLLLAVSGLAMAWPLVGSFGALTTTAYGWTLLGKLSAVAAIVVIAAYNRQRLVPIVTAALPSEPATTTEPTADERTTDATATPHRAWRVLASTVRLEAMVIVAVLLVTGFLVSQQPAAEQAGLRGLYETTTQLSDDLEIDVVVDPNRAGRNTIHVYVVDATGRPSDTVEDVTFELTYVDEGIGPIVVEPLFAGPGHWIATVDDLRFPGTWELRAVAGVDRFTEHTATVSIPVQR